MFGYVLANHSGLTTEEDKRYRDYYCALCRAIRNRHGQLARVTLSYDMTFLLILLCALYEPEQDGRVRRCALHPSKKLQPLGGEYVQYVADMNVALAYQKCIDDWRDEKRKRARAQAALLRGDYRRVKQAYPRQVEAVENALAEIDRLEKSGACDPDEGARWSGRMLMELFVYREDVWAPTLRTMGSALGQFIYLMDAYEDFETDRKKGLFNPLGALYGEDDFDGRIKQILLMLMGECTRAFETLPILQDVEILRNILYSGVWTRYEIVRKRRQGGKGNKDD